ncbi:uncharacterized protein LOC120169321 [Hibiscus syriacus]|uniref:uncharacterized protein LOC120169321 n=1 Tax=Hibiscus syriacus TaxID=106335 RepID=UPI00192108FE|nr:uncharacterized protein LOC120169321 [Hibiscus syriacus]
MNGGRTFYVKCGLNNEQNEPISLKQKLKSSLRLLWLRRRRRHHHHHQLSTVSASTNIPLSQFSPSPKDNNHESPRQSCSSTACLKSPELKDKYRNLVNRIGNNHLRNHSFGHTRRSSADFRYDPSSYALNFDEGRDDSQYDEFTYRNFSARLPPSPPAAHNSTEITA